MLYQPDCVAMRKSGLSKIKDILVFNSFIYLSLSVKSKIMLSKTCVYAIKIMILLALNAQNKKQKVSVSEIAKGIGAPQHFIAKVLQKLSRSRLIKSSPGPGGGYFLPEGADYTISEVMAAMDEAHVLTSCVLGFEECSLENPCPLHEQFAVIREEMNLLFNNLTISKVSKSVKEGDSSLLG